jgi:hypothetical protein
VTTVRLLLVMSLVGMVLLGALFSALPGSLSVRAQQRTEEQPLVDLLPSAGDISADLVQSEDRSRSLDEQASMFANASEMTQRLTDWGWQENVFRVYQSTIPTDSGAPSATIDVSLTRFASPDGAAAALPVFLEDRAAVLGESEVQRPLQLGDETRALTGEIEQGDDVTLYVRQGNLLLRVSVTTLQGTPIAPERIAQGMLTGVGAQTEVTEQPQTVESGPLASYLLSDLPIPNAGCFSVASEGALDLPALQGRYGGVLDLEDELQRMGWQGGDFRQFGCDNPPGGNAGWIDITVQEFASPDDASVAVYYFADARGRSTNLQAASASALGDATAALSGPGVNGEDYTLYFSSGPLLFSVTGVAPDGDPRADVGDVAASLYERSLGAPVADTPVIVTPQPTAPVIAQETPLPTTVPTIAPPATSTPVPTVAPTAIPFPTETPVPTTVPVVIPTSTPLPPPAPTAAAPAPTATRTTTTAPTPTPRVIRPPTPVGEGQ